MSDYQMVYPGPRGPIPTRQSEALRQGWHDCQLLTLLKQQGNAGDLAAIIKDYKNGAPLADPHRRALNAAAKQRDRHRPIDCGVNMMDAGSMTKGQWRGAAASLDATSRVVGGLAILSLCDSLPDGVQ